MTIRKGHDWGEPTSGSPDGHLSGSDAALARRVIIPTTETAPKPPLWHYQPGHGADLARAIGLGVNGPIGVTEVVLDALLVELGGDDDAGPFVAVNAVELGAVADRLGRYRRRHRYSVSIDARPAWSGRAAGLLVANGQFLRGHDVAPRGHPGDGRLEVQIYAMGPGERAEMRRRLATGIHVPHPGIMESRGRRIEVKTSRPTPVIADGVAVGTTRDLLVSVLSGALRLVL